MDWMDEARWGNTKPLNNSHKHSEPNQSVSAGYWEPMNINNPTSCLTPGQEIWFEVDILADGSFEPDLGFLAFQTMN